MKIVSKNNNNNNKPRGKKGAQPSSAKRNEVAVVVKANMTNPKNNTKPKNKNKNRSNNPNREIVDVPFDEVLADIHSKSTFECVSWTQNPGLASSYPWLYKNAAQYERYEFTSLEFEYVSLIPEISANAKGHVGMMFDPDATESNPTSTSNFLNNQVAFSKRPDLSWKLKVPQSILKKNKDFLLIRTGRKPDVKFYDVGKFIVMKSGQATDGEVMGYVKMRGNVRFYDRNTESPNSFVPNNMFTRLMRDSAASQSIPETVYTAITWTTVASTSDSETNGLGLLAGSTINLPQGIFFVRVQGSIGGAGDIQTIQSRFQGNADRSGMQTSWAVWPGTATTRYEIFNSMVIQARDQNTLSFEVYQTNAGISTPLDFYGNMDIFQLR